MMNLSELHIIPKPYPVLVFDNVFPAQLARAAFASWPNDTWDNWFRYHDKHSLKYASKCGRDAPASCLLLLDKLSQFPLEEYYGPLKLPVCHFFPDMSYYAGGLHCVHSGGKLDCHIDALQHPIKNWVRVANLILYVTPAWSQEWGGHLNIHNEDQSIAHSVSPKFNRLVVFEPTPVAFHSVGAVSDTSEPRCSLATFFWKQGECNLNTTARF